MIGRIGSPWLCDGNDQPTALINRNQTSDGPTHSVENISHSCGPALRSVLPPTQPGSTMVPERRALSGVWARPQLWPVWRLPRLLLGAVLVVEEIGRAS